jgi:hypothetical protein
MPRRSAAPHRKERYDTQLGGRDQSAKALNYAVERFIYL